MATTKQLMKELKTQLRQRGITYKRLADELGLSESAVKQMFGAGNMSLQRLESVCKTMGLDIADLVECVNASMKTIEMLSVEDEARLISDSKLLLVAYCVVNYWTFSEILENYDITEHECVRQLAALDKMKLIELLPGNRIKPLMSGNFAWHENGPIEKYFRQEVQGQFFGSSFSNRAELRLVKSASISESSREQLVEKLRSVGLLFDETAQSERNLSIKSRTGTTMVLAIRHWQFEAFKALEKSKEGN